MTGLTFPFTEEKLRTSEPKAREFETSRHRHADTKWMFQMDTERVWCYQANIGDSGAEDDRPLYSSQIINNYIGYIQENHPNIEIKTVLESAGMSEQEIEDPGHWFSQKQTDRFHEIIVSQTGNPHISRDAGRFSVSSKKIGAAKQYALGFINPASVYLGIGRVAKTISRGAEVSGRKSGSSRVEIVSVPSAGTREKPYQCENRIGLLEAVGKIFTNQYADIEHPDCFHRGDEFCRYIVTWEKTSSIFWKQLRTVMFFVGLLTSAVFFPLLSLESWFVLVIIGAFLNLTILSNSHRLEKKELIKTIKTQGNAARDLMDEMNTRHSHALLIQENGQAISKILDVDRIIDTVLAGIKRRMDFDRGMVLLSDPTRSRLQFVDGFGYTDDQVAILCDHEFNLGNPEIKSGFIRAFYEQKPFWVKNVAEIENDLLPEMLSLIRQMKVRSYVCVPLLYEKEALGVIITEKNNSHSYIVQSEINLLMGVASQTAISIINARSIKKIRKSEQQYRLLADNISDVIWIIDVSTLKFSFVSPSVERLHGFTPTQYMALELREILPPASYKRAQSIIAEELVKEASNSADPFRSRTLQLEHYNKNGSTMWIELTASFLRDKTGEITGILGISRDITERKKASREKKMLESRLQQAHKMEAIGTLAGGIAHDFNNILSAVIGYTEMALEDSQEGTLIYSNLKGVLLAGNRAKDLVGQILTFSRQADQELKPVQVDLIVREVLKLLRASFPSTIDIQQNIASKSATLANPTQIHQVLMNLCTNAEHAMQGKGGLLAVSLTDISIDSEIEAGQLGIRPGAYLRLEVKDTGDGMAAEVKERIFDPFFTTKETGKGTGMGLSVVHGIVKSHRGAIAVKSEPENGTTFEVFLPISRHAAEITTDAGDEFPGGNECILLVDDEKTLVDLGRQMLERLGYSVESKTCSIEALEMFKTRSEEFDLVITDMTMPNLTGDKLAAELMKIRTDIPVILCTGFSEQISEKHAKEMGIKEFILKPLLLNKLAATVRAVLDGG
ncbi:MAG: ATP-binding protein [Desulfobacterales bacterium]|jgi:PAS domain S-box-containing protein